MLVAQDMPAVSHWWTLSVLGNETGISVLGNKQRTCVNGLYGDHAHCICYKGIGMGVLSTWRFEASQSVLAGER